jgi:catechol 2,3-dioxygenase-like lactoylglutathione lyase family enzyme
MPARFHEISVPTADIRGSMSFYQSVGFTAVDTGDALPHRYGVITDGRLVLGLHEAPELTPGLTFVRPELSQWAAELAASGLTPAVQHTHPEAFNEIAFDDPEGNRLWFIEAPIHATVAARQAIPACGEFLHLSLPTRNPEAMCAFWEGAGFVALGTAAEPYEHLALTSDHLNLALHAPRLLDAPMLVFAAPAAGARIDFLGTAGHASRRPLPRGLPRGSTLLEAPEGTPLLILAQPGDNPES